MKSFYKHTKRSHKGILIILHSLIGEVGYTDLSFPVDQGVLQSNSCSFTVFFKIFLKSVFSSHEDMKCLFNCCMYKSPGYGIYGISFYTMVNLEIKEP